MLWHSYHLAGWWAKRENDHRIGSYTLDMDAISEQENGENASRHG